MLLISILSLPYEFTGFFAHGIVARKRGDGTSPSMEFPDCGRCLSLAYTAVSRLVSGKISTTRSRMPFRAAMAVP